MSWTQKNVGNSENRKIKKNDRSIVIEQMILS